MKKPWAVFLAGSMFFLSAWGGKSAGEQGNGSEKVTDSEVKLTCYSPANNEKSYLAALPIHPDDVESNRRSEEPNFVRLENKRRDYQLDLTLDAAAKETYDQLQAEAAEGSYVYEETQFGAFPGSYAEKGAIYGYILLDGTDPAEYVFLKFRVTLAAERPGKVDIRMIYGSKFIQEILCGVAFHL